MEQTEALSKTTNLPQKALELKNKVVSSLDTWGNNLIDSFVSDKPRLKPLSVYMKRGLTNGLVRYDGKITKAVDDAMMFIGDENGNYDTSKIFDDVMSMFKDMDEMNFNLGPLDGTIGKGIIRIKIPNNMFTSMLFGDTGAIKITESDIMDLKTLFIEE